jgi:hypothetical protein
MADAARAGRPHIQLFARDEMSPVRWRLLGGNNRELGRGQDEFHDAVAARRELLRLQAIAPTLEHSVHRSASSTWSWVLTRAGVIVATSGFRYDRLIRCRQGLAQFVDVLAACEVGTNVMYTQSRRWAASFDRTSASPRGRS